MFSESEAQRYHDIGTVRQVPLTDRARVSLTNIFACQTVVWEDVYRFAHLLAIGKDNLVVHATVVSPPSRSSRMSLKEIV